MKLVPAFTLLLSLSSALLVSASTCSDKKTGLWTIGRKSRNWCHWAKRDGDELIAERCEKKNLYEDCPETCGSCQTPPPQTQAVVSTATPAPSRSCEALTKEFGSHVKTEIREVLDQDRESMRTEMRELIKSEIRDRTNEIMNMLKGTKVPTRAPVVSRTKTSTRAVPTISTRDIAATGGWHTCVIHDIHKLLCWGWNSYGQLGAGNNFDSLVPTKVAFTNDILQVELGGSHSCALDSLSKLFCWGWNLYGQLGLGDNSNRYNPTELSLGNDVSLIRLGLYHTCAVDVLRNLFCWGRNRVGSVGTGDTINRNVPTQINFDNGISQLEIGNAHSCVVDESEHLYCWGWNEYGQLGFADVRDRHTPTLLLMSNGVSMLALGNGHTCVVDSLFKLLCWGWNEFGQLGLSDTANRYTPTEVLSSMNGVSDIALGLAVHSCAIDKNDDLWCWGRNIYGELGLGNNTNRNTPVKIPSLSGVSQISLGYSHSCAIDKNDDFWCWGWNKYGELGRGDKTYHDTPTLIDVL